MIRYLLFVLLFIPELAVTAWQQIAKLPAPVGSCFFLNDQVGFAGTGSFERAPLTPLQIWVTVDGGYTWFQASTPSGVGQVTQIVVAPDGTGYASIFSQGNTNLNRWRTTDGGNSWTDASLPGTYGAGVGINGQLASWTPTLVTNQNTNGIFSFPGIGTLITPGPNSTGLPGESWSAFGDSTDGVVYTVAELGRSIMFKLPTGNWARRYDLSSLVGNRYPTGHIHGSKGVMYIQTEADGIIRTGLADSGKTWRLVGGPSNNIDTRSFWVMGCRGEVVIAFDSTGAVWKTTDGGDGTLSSNSQLIWEQIVFPVITACSSITKSAKLLNNQCGNIVLTSVVMEKNPGVYQFVPPTLPDTLSEGASYTAVVDLVPNGNYGTFTSQIRIKGYIDASGNKRFFDSVIKVSAAVNGENPKLTLNLSTLDLGSAGICGEKKDSVFVFKNTGCDTLEIIAGPGTLASEFTIDNIPLPYSLPHDSSVTINAHFIPVTLGVKSTIASYTARMHGKTQDVSFELKGIGTDGAGILSYEPQSFDFDTLSVCSPPDTLFGFLTNVGCVAITIENFAFGGMTDYTLVGANPNGAVLQPKDTVRYGVRFSPQLKGARTASIAIRSKNSSSTGISKDDTATILGFVGDGTKTIASTPNGGIIDLGTVFLCDETSAMVQVRNTGCDTIVLTRATLAGSGFTIDTSQLPTILAPGEDISLEVVTMVDTSGGKTQNSATLSFTSESENSLSPITYTRTISFPGNASFGITSIPLPSNHTGTAGDPVRFALIESPSEKFTNANIRSLEFDLGYNSDLITYTGKQGANTLTTSDSRHFTLTGNPYITADANGYLAELDFRIYLTKDSSTDLIISNVTTGGSSQDPCASSVTTTTGTSFTYTYECADHLLQDFMKGESLQLGIVKPNPASSEISFVVESPIKESVEVMITGLNGIVFEKQRRNVVSGKNELQLPIITLPGGSYILTVTSTAATVSRRFVRVK